MPWGQGTSARLPRLAKSSMKSGCDSVRAKESVQRHPTTFEHCQLASAKQPDALETQIDHLVDLFTIDRSPFGCRLNLDDLVASSGNKVQIDSRLRVLGVAEIEQQLIIDVTDADRRNLIFNHRDLQDPPLAQGIEGQHHSDETCGNRCSSCTAVGFEHVAINHDLTFAQVLAIHGGAQSATDESLDLARSSPERPFASIAFLSTMRVGSRVHLVLRRHPSLTSTLEELRDLLIDASRRQHDGATGSIQNRSLGESLEPGNDLGLTQGILGAIATVSAHDKGANSTLRGNDMALNLSKSLLGRKHQPARAMDDTPSGSSLTEGIRLDRLARLRCTNSSASSTWSTWHSSRSPERSPSSAV